MINRGHLSYLRLYNRRQLSSSLRHQHGPFPHLPGQTRPVTCHCFHFPNLKNKAVHQNNFLNNFAASETSGYSISTTFSFDEVIFGKVEGQKVQRRNRGWLAHTFTSIAQRLYWLSLSYYSSLGGDTRLMQNADQKDLMAYSSAQSKRKNDLLKTSISVLPPHEYWSQSSLWNQTHCETDFVRTVPSQNKGLVPLYDVLLIFILFFLCN